MARRDDYTLFCERYNPEVFDNEGGIKRYDNVKYLYQEALDKAGENNEYLWTIIEGGSGKWYLVKGFHYVNRECYIVCSVPWDENSRDYLYG